MVSSKTIEDVSFFTTHEFVSSPFSVLSKSYSTMKLYSHVNRSPGSSAAAAHATACASPITVPEHVFLGVPLSCTAAGLEKAWCLSVTRGLVLDPQGITLPWFCGEMIDAVVVDTRNRSKMKTSCVFGVGAKTDPMSDPVLNMKLHRFESTYPLASTKHMDLYAEFTGFRREPGLVIGRHYRHGRHKAVF
jgi:hypothetical protein